MPKQKIRAEGVRQKFQKLIKRSWKSKGQGDVSSSENPNERKQSGQFMGPHRIDSVHQYYEQEYAWKIDKLQQEVEEMGQLGCGGYAKKRTFEVYTGIRSHHIIQEIKRLRKEFQACQSKCYGSGETTYSEIQNAFPKTIGASGQSQSLEHQRTRENYLFKYQDDRLKSISESYSQGAQEAPDMEKSSTPQGVGSTLSGMEGTRNEPEVAYMGLRLIREPMSMGDKSPIATQRSTRAPPALVRKSSNIQEWPLRYHLAVDNTQLYGSHDGYTQQATSGMSFTQLLSQPQCTPSSGNSTPISAALLPPNESIPCTLGTGSDVAWSRKDEQLPLNATVLEHVRPSAIRSSVDESAHHEDDISQCSSIPHHPYPENSEIIAEAETIQQSNENEEQEESFQKTNQFTNSECDASSEVRIVVTASPAPETDNALMEGSTSASHPVVNTVEPMDPDEENESLASCHVQEHDGCESRSKDTAPNHTNTAPCTHKDTVNLSSSLPAGGNLKSSIQDDEHTRNSCKRPVHDSASLPLLQVESCSAFPPVDFHHSQFGADSQCNKPTVDSCEGSTCDQLQEPEQCSNLSIPHSEEQGSPQSAPTTPRLVKETEEVSQAPVVSTLNRGASQAAMTSSTNDKAVENILEEHEASPCAAKEIDSLQSPEEDSGTGISPKTPTATTEKECIHWHRSEHGALGSSSCTLQIGFCHGVSESGEACTCSEAIEVVESHQGGVHQATCSKEHNESTGNISCLPHTSQDPGAPTVACDSTSMDFSTKGANIIDPVEVSALPSQLEDGICSENSYDPKHPDQDVEDHCYLLASAEEDAEDLDPGGGLLIKNDDASNSEASSTTNRCNSLCDLDKEEGLEEDILWDLINEVQLAESSAHHPLPLQSPISWTDAGDKNNTSPTASGCSQPWIDHGVLDKDVSKIMFPSRSLHERSCSEESTVLSDKSRLTSSEEGYHSSEQMATGHKELCDNLEWSEFDPNVRRDNSVGIEAQRGSASCNPHNYLECNSGDEQQDSFIKMPEFLTSFSGGALADDDYILKLPDQLEGWAGDEESSGSLSRMHQEQMWSGSTTHEP